MSTRSLGPKRVKQALKIDCLEPELTTSWSGSTARPPDIRLNWVVVKENILRSAKSSQVPSAYATAESLLAFWAEGGVDAMLILENVARAFTAGEAERGLMNSPGHRANILSKEATRVGLSSAGALAGIGGNADARSETSRCICVRMVTSWSRDAPPDRGMGR